MVCKVKTSLGEWVFYRFEDLRKSVSEFGNFWIAKCEGNDEETVKMRSLLLDMIDEATAFYIDGSFGPYRVSEGDE